MLLASQSSISLNENDIDYRKEINKFEKNQTSLKNQNQLNINRIESGSKKTNRE